ncbi:MAG: hypothetical protein V2J02_12460 [Pseudomonadales bacterium]|nr:hypothetical protein [Pseudomonadales bacterium]
MSFGEVLGWLFVLFCCGTYLGVAWQPWPRDVFGAATPWLKAFLRAWSYVPLFVIYVVLEHLWS